MINLVVINESFCLKALRRRWVLFAKQHQDINVILCIPKLGKKNDNYNNELSNNFKIEILDTKTWGHFGWISNDFKNVIVKHNADIVYNIGTHNQLCLIQFIRDTKKYRPNAKMVSFSMRGPYHNLNNQLYKSLPISQFIRRLLILPIAKAMQLYFNKNVDAVLCHYPVAEECFRQEGYNGPIYIQTQVGVNPECFHVNEESRNRIRRKYGIGEDFLFGSATRFILGKGLEDIILALPSDKKWKYLMMGTGTTGQIAKIKEQIIERGLEDRIILTGFIQNSDMPDYWNALDCAVHVPRTTPEWVETYSVALVQAMATRLPVIANDSGAVGYQVGSNGMITKEGDINALRDCFVSILENKLGREKLAEKMYKRAICCFSIEHLNDLFYKTLVNDVLKGKFCSDFHDMADEKYER